MRVLVISFLLVAIAVFTPSVAYAQKDGAERKMVGALNVALGKFSDKLAKIDKSKSDHAKYMSQSENYDVGISESRGVFIIVFLPKNRNIIGGGAEYHVRRDDFEIVKFVGYE